MKVTCFKNMKCGRLRAGMSFVGTCLVFLLVPAIVWALELGDAKQRGLVGERANGYIAAVSGNPDPAVSSLVNKINQARKEEYQRIAQKNGSPLSVVEKIAAKKAIEKTPAGQFVQRENGTWVKK